MKFSGEIVKLGDMVEEFIKERMIIIFNEDAPDELAEISAIHNSNILKEDVKVGDTVLIGNLKYEVVAVGDGANKTLKELGHCTFKFKDSNIADLPGVINLKGDDLKELKIGYEISIY
ncbi:PTS glucitol/sorbitol transporter subunit IIA [Anaerosalibacter bizertensis]|uniref:PTS glucitol/sorbitol transporter subunit IIA n=1 Tax=Anaerosalibacter bizertensis TaxID=932217 RepID=UPI001D005CAD|nr:PTS glucitol/sorbitol transporter subunit IIA [Anaerosalibacter bizertensis]MBV1817746.1 PTS glucitol/sorbitol transporter subunit IIA [Bacteroidales bacterium MSK.15.36]MCB5559315.1 PTS glucitol/sorbitol transporter subunit IIA [Anaerosalibacter bizertensis]MCG4583007.1 PTS glucitol/sorbitol transporter subunit IIA [Anaerosalibacter bizertensis]